MSALRAQQLAQRRHALRARSRSLRARAGRHAQALQPVLGWADRAQAAWRWVRERPPELLWPLALVAGLWVARRPSRLVSAPLRLWSVWRLWLRLSAGRRV
jgi:hypothetical protein